ncbi:WD40-repeat-containing domain protein [Suillus variegatus]|nr:WD40-repeat-containing domain protein [Suillus variegatus]
MAQLILNPTPLRLFEDHEGGSGFRVIDGQHINDKLRTNAIAVSPDGQRMVTASWNIICLWDMKEGVLLKRLEGHSSSIVNALSVSRDGQLIASGDDKGTLIAWDLNIGESLTQAIKAHSGGIPSLAFSPGGSLLATGSEDGMIKLWCTKTWELLGNISRWSNLSVYYYVFESSVCEAAWQGQQGLIQHIYNYYYPTNAAPSTCTCTNSEPPPAMPVSGPHAPSTSPTSAAAAPVLFMQSFLPAAAGSIPTSYHSSPSSYIVIDFNIPSSSLLPSARDLARLGDAAHANRCETVQPVVANGQEVRTTAATQVLTVRFVQGSDVSGYRLSNLKSKGTDSSVASKVHFDHPQNHRRLEGEGAVKGMYMIGGGCTAMGVFDHRVMLGGFAVLGDWRFMYFFDITGLLCHANA